MGFQTAALCLIFVSRDFRCALAEPEPATRDRVMSKKSKSRRLTVVIIKDATDAFALSQTGRGADRCGPD